MSVGREDISNDFYDSNYNLKNLTDMLMLWSREKTEGFSIPTKQELREGFVNPYLLFYNGLKVQLLHDKTISNEKFEKELNHFIHQDEVLLKKALNLVSSRNVEYKDNIIYCAKIEEASSSEEEDFER